MELPAHGTRSRYERGCKCIYCVRWREDMEIIDLRWSTAPLNRHVSTAQLREKGYGTEQIDDWIKNGIPDFVADCVCCEFRLLPFQVWGQAWDEASFDFYREVTDEEE